MKSSYTRLSKEIDNIVNDLASFFMKKSRKMRWIENLYFSYSIANLKLVFMRLIRSFGLPIDA